MYSYSFLLGIPQNRVHFSCVHLLNSFKTERSDNNCGHNIIRG